MVAADVEIRLEIEREWIASEAAAAQSRKQQSRAGSRRQPDKLVDPTGKQSQIGVRAASAIVFGWHNV
jgi:hypothetical protein